MTAGKASANTPAPSTVQHGTKHEEDTMTTILTEDHREVEAQTMGEVQTNADRTVIGIRHQVELPGYVNHYTEDCSLTAAMVADGLTRYRVPPTGRSVVTYRTTILGGDTQRALKARRFELLTRQTVRGGGKPLTCATCDKPIW